MRVSYEDLQFWKVTAAKEPFLSSYDKAKEMYDRGIEPIIVWHSGTEMTVEEGDTLKTDIGDFKDFKQSNRQRKKKKKK